MSTNDIVFGTKIILNDRSNPVAEDTDIGLYNVTSDFTANASAAQKNVVVADGTEFDAGQLVYISDSVSNEENVIDSISTNTLTMKRNLANAYTTANSASVTADSAFGWIQNDITGLTGNWKAGMLVHQGIGKWTKTIDLKRGGNIAQSGSASATVKNTSEFSTDLSDNGIYLNGCKMEIYKFTDTTPTKQWSGICEDPVWNSKEYNINAKGYHNKRIANLGTEIDSVNYPNATGDILGENIPCTFGTIKPVFDVDGNSIYDGYAKAVRVANRESVYFNMLGYRTVNEDEKITLETTQLYNNTNLEIFPIVGNDGNTPPLSFKIKLFAEDSWSISRWRKDTVIQTTGTLDLTWFNGKYIKIIEGAANGSYRAISSAYVDLDDDPLVIVLTMNDYFSETPVGNAAATEENQSWCKIIEIERGYSVDAFPCYSYLDVEGNGITTGLNLFSFDDDSTVTVSGERQTVNIDKKPISFIRLPMYAYKDSGSGNKNLIDIDVKLFNGSIDKMDSFLVLPVVNLSTIKTSDLSSIDESDYEHVVDGVYKKSISPGSGQLFVDSVTEGTKENAFDKDHDSYYEFNLSAWPGYVCWYTAFDLTKPAFPDRFKFDSLYLGLRYKFSFEWGDPIYMSSFTPRFKAYWRRFVGAANEIVDSDNLYQGGFQGFDFSITVQSLPDQYYTIDPFDNNKFFYYNDDGSEDNTLVSGYSTFELNNVDTEDKYNSIDKIAIGMRMCYQNSTAPKSAPLVTTNIKVYEAALMFKKSVSIKNEIYTPFKGRIFNDTWDTRKTAADLMETPIDIMEHVERLSCWADSSPCPDDGWGKGYALGAKIDTAYFDDETDPAFAYLKTVKCSNQLLSYDDCYTDKIQRSLCKDFFLAKWYDKDGDARIERISKTETTPSDSITLSDIVDRKSIKITEPSPTDIFPEPIVRYRKNFATGKYEGILKVTNASAQEYTSGYVHGVENETEAEEIWDKCHALWLKAGHLEKPPTALTDKQWFNSDGADQLAKEYLVSWVDWMFNPKIRFSVHFNTAGDWEEAHRFLLQLPHQTDNTEIECIATKIVVSPNTPYYVTIEAIMLRETTPESLYIKDTWTNFSDDNDWKDTWVDQTGDDDIKDF